MTHCWSRKAQAALDPALRGLVHVLGGPGTGKTSLLIDAAAAHIAAGVDPQSVLVLTGSGRIPIRARSTLTTTLLATRMETGSTLPAVIREPLVRTVHGYAFAVLRSSAQRAGGLPPRLITSAEQDSIIRELLAGNGTDAWPSSLHAALGTDGFAGEVRNLLARCAERGVDPAQLVRLGKRSGHPEWVAAGRLAQQYEQVMLLRSAVGTAAPQATMPALGAAELVGAALDAFAADPDLLADERIRVRLLLVDDAQQLDPQAARLVRALAVGVGLTLIAGDPSQAIFGFRGGEPTALSDRDGWLPRGGDVASLTLTLTTSHRCAPAVARAIRGIAGRLPGVGVPRKFDGTGPDIGSVEVRLAASGTAEAALIADTLRRAHLMDGVPWSQMAVIVRSVPRAHRLPRALASAGVPVAIPAATGALCEQPAVAALLNVLTATVDGLDGKRAEALLSGPIGRVDPIAMRQLRRTLRRAGNAAGASGELGDELAAVLSPKSESHLRGEPGRLPAAHARPLHRVRAVLDAAARCQRDGRDPRYVLWQAWDRSGLQRRWLAASDRGGPAGVQADRDLDAVTALFDVAEQYVSQTGGASLRGLIAHVSALRIATPRVEPALGTETVQVLSVHAALGNQWDLVVIAGLQDGLWPNTVPRGGVLNTQRLLDTLDGIGTAASPRAPLLAEERRMLVSAMGRACRRLLVTAVDGEGGAGTAGDELPSGFFTELAQYDTSGGAAATAPVAAPRLLSTAAVVGRLRGAVCAPHGASDGVADAHGRAIGATDARAHAAAQLARLARAGVPGADPAGWHGMLPISSDEPLWRADGDHAVTLSPSSLQTLIDCPLRWMIERHGGTEPHDLRSSIGSMIHALIAQSGKTESELLAGLDRAWQRLPFESRWHSANELERHRTMLTTFTQWRDGTRDRLTEAGVEVDFDQEIAGLGVRLRGRIDRIEREPGGRLVVIDVKTGKTPITKDDAQRHAQLAMYQLAVEAGLAGSGGGEPGGGRLVYLGKAGTTGAVEREQDPVTPATRDHWHGQIAQAAAATAGPGFVARVNDGCRHCPIRSSCPAHTQGTDR
ncbi:MAG TPA: ATP-dependent DNA helicase [Mycobacterium sp.]